MTKHSFLELDPIHVRMLDKEILLFPAVKPSGQCEFASVPMEILLPVEDRFMRVTGTFKLSAWESKSWLME